MKKSNPAILVSLSLILAAVLVGGCASIVHSGNRKIEIDSRPTGAKASITKPDGTLVGSFTTPCIFSLDPKKGYFSGQSYLLKLELTGYKTATVELKPKLSGWYFGNIVFGGLIGMVIVDPITGSMWNIAPGKIDQELSASQTSVIREHRGFLVVLLSQTTENERQQMVRIN